MLCVEWCIQFCGTKVSIITMITIIDYGIGNIASVVNMVSRVSREGVIIKKSSELIEASKIIITGVGSFDHGIRSLTDDKWIDALNEAVLVRRVPVLGICLGMQLMCRSSEEGRLPGLGWIDAEVKRFNFPTNSENKIPHMGWNVIEIVKSNPLIESSEVEQRFYFVHSYYAVCNHPQDVLATAHHGNDFVAAFSHENIYGVQFHPEKSHLFGMALMKKFVEL